MKLKHSLLLSFTLAIVGCGLKGDLYMPEPVVVNQSSEPSDTNENAIGSQPEAAGNTEEKSEDKKEGLHYQPTESGVPR